MHEVNMACQNNAQVEELVGKQEYEKKVRGLCRELEQNSE